MFEAPATCGRSTHQAEGNRPRHSVARGGGGGGWPSGIRSLPSGRGRLQPGKGAVRQAGGQCCSSPNRPRPLPRPGPCVRTRPPPSPRPPPPEPPSPSLPPAAPPPAPQTPTIGTGQGGGTTVTPIAAASSATSSNIVPIVVPAVVLGEPPRRAVPLSSRVPSWLHRGRGQRCVAPPCTHSCRSGRARCNHPGRSWGRRVLGAWRRAGNCKSLCVCLHVSPTPPHPGLLPGLIRPI